MIVWPWGTLTLYESIHVKSLDEGFQVQKIGRVAGTPDRQKFESVQPAESNASYSIFIAI